MTENSKQSKVVLKQGEIVIKKEDWRGFIASGLVGGFLALLVYALVAAPTMFDKVTSTLGPLVGLIVGYYFRDKTKGGE